MRLHGPFYPVPPPPTSPPVAAPRTRLSLCLLLTGSPAGPALPEPSSSPALPESPVCPELLESPVYGTNQSFIVELGFLGVHSEEDHQR